MRVKFPATLVRRLIKHAEEAADHRPTYSQLTAAEYRADGKEGDFNASESDVRPGSIPAGLWLVGDSGVYLMSNGKPGLDLDGGPRQVVAYAKGIDPDVDGHEAADDRKRRSFGGDDGVEFLSLADLAGALQPGDQWLEMAISASRISVYK